MREDIRTPWPWFVRQFDGDEWPEKRISVGPHGIAVMISPRYAGSEVLADAHLIASAPELLEACENLLNYLETEDMRPLNMNLARAAIKKAYGEES